MSGQLAPSGESQAARQLFAPGADAILRLAALTLVGGALVASIFLYMWSQGSFIGGADVVQAQPVPFSHKHHSGELGIDCRNCHQQVEYAATAGLPPTHTCMTCHSQIWTASEMLAPVRDSYAADQPLHWTRVNHLPDYVYFNHSIHITKGVGCSSCHGAVDTMQMTYPAQSFRMEFCLNCHRNPAQYLRPAAQIWNMEWTPPDNQAQIGAQLVKDGQIAGPNRLSDCSICHR